MTAALWKATGNTCAVHKEYKFLNIQIEQPQRTRDDENQVPVGLHSLSTKSKVVAGSCTHPSRDKTVLNLSG